MAEISVQSSKTQKNGTDKKNTVSSKSRTDLSQSLDSPVKQILYLQRTIGNRAVTHLFQSGAIQARLKISKPNDIYEKEAERVSEQVMRRRDRSLINGQWSLGRKEEPEEEKEETPVFTKAVTGSSPEVTPNIESNINSLKGGGQPLSESTRAFFEPRFSADFSQVRVHNDSRAAQTAQSINAKAFTTGKDIVFNSGQYSTDTSSGKRLLAHELTHVVQQVNCKAIYNKDSDSFPFSYHSYGVELSRNRFTGGMRNGLFKVLKNTDLNSPTLQRVYKHEPGGPYHPPKGVKLRCTYADDCSSISSKIDELKKTIKAHKDWDKKHSFPEYPAGRHAKEIEDFENALKNCIKIHQKKCIK